jgi:hypothetical protein
MNFGTIPNSQLTIDLADSVGMASYVIPIGAGSVLVLGVAVLWIIGSRITRGRGEK